MKVKNVVKKVAVLGGSTLMVGATVMGALAYDLATYPAKFIENGQMSGKIIVGEKAATSDVMGAVDIGASLQALAVTKEPIEIPGQAGSVNLEGDAFKIETSSDKFELREKVGDVYDTVSETDLAALKGGSITTDEGTTDYNQYLRLEVLPIDGNNDGNLDDPEDDLGLVEWGVNYIENDDDEVADFMVVERETDLGFFEWELEFEEGLESEIDSQDDLKDIEGEVFNIFGTDFTFVDSDLVDTAGERDLTLDFMTGQVADILREGETKTYTIDGVDYEVTLAFVSDPQSGGNEPEAKFSVNGETTDALVDGDSDVLSGGLQIGVREILVNAREGIVEFFLGADKVQFRDADTSNDAFAGALGADGGGVEINNEKIEDGAVSIRTNVVKGTTPVGEGDVIEITSIRYRLMADAASHTDLYIPTKHGIKEYLDEPEGMLSPTFNIRYEGLTTPEKKDVKFDARADDQYYLTFSNIKGDEYSFPFLSIDDSGIAKFGDDDETDFVFEELDAGLGTQCEVADANIGLDDYFVVSNADAGVFNKKSVTAVLQFQDIDDSDHIVTFEDLAQGTKTMSYDAGTFSGNLVVGGHTFKVYVDEANQIIAVDMNGDGDCDGDIVSMTVFGGGVLSITDVWGSLSGSLGNPWSGDGLTILDTNLEDANVDMELNFESSLYDEAPATGETLTWTVRGYEDTDYYVDITDLGSANILYEGADKYNEFNFYEPDDKDDHKYGTIGYGALVDHYNPSGTNDPDELTITVPKEQVLAQVFAVAGTTSEAEGNLQRDVVNPIPVGLAMLDKDAPALGEDNLIVVGGPCANTVAAELMGNPENCAEGFTPGKALIKAYDTNEKVAVLVAGYEAQETVGASYVLANFKDYNLAGTEVEVVVTDLNDITVKSVG